uniref:RING-H2 finger protein ATL73 n=1 Tax=Zeugodacus cucurbitae TaxID=28588 RepID=A0A0A1WHR0_ZEUCU
MKYLFCAYIFLFTINSIAKCLAALNRKYTAHDQTYDTDYYGSFEEEDEYEIEVQELPEECKTLQYFVLIRKCTDLYPEDIKETYNDDFVEANNQYAVFGFEDEGVEHHFLTFQHSALFHCDEIEILGVANFLCRNATGSSEEIQLRNSFIKCLDHQSNMVDELLVACSPKLNKSTTFTALHYSNFIPKQRSSADHVTTMILHNWLWLAFVTFTLCIEI